MPYPRLLPDDETLLTLREQYSTRQLAKMYGVSITAVTKALNKAGFVSEMANHTIDELAALNERFSVSEIARMLGQSRQNIHKRLTSGGYTIKKHGRNKKRVTLPDDKTLKVMYQQLTMQEMATQLKCSASLIQKRLQALPVDRTVHLGRGGQKPKLPDKRTLQMLRKTKSVSQIATMFDVTPPAVYKKLK